MNEGYEIEYKDDGCCLHPCLATECPEPVCFLDCGGYKKTWPKYRQAIQMASEGKSVSEISKTTGISVRKLNKFLEILVVA